MFSYIINSQDGNWRSWQLTWQNVTRNVFEISFFDGTTILQGLLYLLQVVTVDILDVSIQTIGWLVERNVVAVVEWTQIVEDGIGMTFHMVLLEMLQQQIAIPGPEI